MGDHSVGGEYTVFYQHFLELCKRDNTTPAAVARDLELSNSATTYWKKGAIPKSDTILKIAKHFQVDASWLLDGLTDEERRTSTLDIYIKALAKNLEPLNGAGQQRVIDRAIEHAKDLAKIAEYQYQNPLQD